MTIPTPSFPWLPQWSAPCPRAEIYVPQPWQTTDIVENLETNTYEARWTCQRCRGLHGLVLPTPQHAREALSRGARHVVVAHVETEKHAGGDPINEDDEIDFWEAWQPRPDESETAVYDRVWAELLTTGEGGEQGDIHA